MKHVRSRWVLDFVAPKELRGREIDLITPAELAEVQPGTVLVTILGESVKVGSAHVDRNTRGGFLAYGFPVGWQP